MQLSAFAGTNVGRRREQNEDHYLVDAELGLFLVCDGMGGHVAGEIASTKAAEFLVTFVRENRATLQVAKQTVAGYSDAMRLAQAAVEDTCRRLHRLACSDSRYAGMGTTLTLLLVLGEKAIMAHVGDSRLYLYRQGEIHLLSTDHTLANEMAREADAEESAWWKQRYSHVLTRTIGCHESVLVDTLLFDLLPDDVCLLCTDGLSNHVNAGELVQVFGQNPLQEIPEMLIEMANSRGGQDNITAVVVHVAADDAEVHNPASPDAQRQLAALKNAFLCRRLSLNRLMQVLNITQTKDFVAGDSVISAGERCAGMYLVVDGCLAVFRDNTKVMDLRPGDVFGEIALQRGSAANATVRATADSRLMLIKRKDFKGLVKRYPKLGRLLLGNLLARLSEDLERLQAYHKPGDTLPGWV